MNSLKIAHNFFAAIIVAILCFGLIAVNIDRRMYDKNYNMLFAEFIQSSDFKQLAEDTSHAFSYRVNGTYNLGIPFSPANETVYGTNRGVRVFPYIAFLSILQKIYGILWDRFLFAAIIIAPYVSFILAYLFFNHRVDRGAILGAALFSLNPWIFNRLKTGFWQLHIAYAFLPWIAYFCAHLNSKMSKKTEVLAVIVTSFGTVVMYLFQPHFLYGFIIAAPLALAYMALIKGEKLISALSLRRTGIVFLFTICMISFHLIPSLLYSPTIYAKTDYFNLGSLFFNGQGSTLGDVLNLYTRLPWEVTTESVKSNMPFAGFYLIFIFSCLFGFLKSKNRKSKFFFIFLFFEILLFSFLSKGINPPFSNFSRLLFGNLPILQVFRDPSRLMSFIVLFGAISTAHIFSKESAKSIYYWVLVYVLITTPYLVEDLNKKLVFQQIPFSRYKENEMLPDHQRMLFLPDNVPMSNFTWHKGPASSTYNSPGEALVPSMSDLLHYSGSNDTRMSQNTLYASSSNNQSVLDRLHVKKLVVDNNSLNSFQKNERGLLDKYSKVGVKDGLSLYSNNKSISLISQSRPIFIVGDRNAYADVAEKIENKVPLIYLNDYYNGELFSKLNLANQEILYDNKSQLDNVFLSTLSKYSLNLHKLVWNYDKDFTYFMPYAQSKIIDGHIFQSGKAINSSKDNANLSVPINKGGDFVLAISILKENKDPSLKVFVDKKEIEPFSVGPNDNLSWNQYRISLKDKSIIEYKKVSTGEIIIDDSLLIPTSVFDSTKKITSNLFKKTKQF